MGSDEGHQLGAGRTPDGRQPTGEKVVYLMRGLPSCGKSTTAKKLAGDSGVACETDDYFYSQVGDDPNRYDYRPDLLAAARRWNFERFRRAVDDGVSPVVVDRGNSLCPETQAYARHAVGRGYRVELREPESEWWREIRGLLADKRRNGPALERWAERLAGMSRAGHRVPVATIWGWMARWRPGLTVEDILNYEPPELPGVARTVTLCVGLRGGSEEWSWRIDAWPPGIIPEV